MLKRIFSLIAAVLVFIGLFVCLMSGFAADGDETIVTGETKTVTVTKDEDACLQFIPEVSGTYIFYSISDSDTYGCLFNSAKSTVLARDDESGENSNFCITYDFEAGTVYYFTARFYTIADGTFDVRLERTSCLHGTPITKEAVTATCTAVGYTQGSYCEFCGEVIVPQSEIAVDPTNHSGTADVTKYAVAATCTAEGYSGDVYWSCCDVLATSGAVISTNANEHTGKANVIKNAKAATCTAKGYTGDIYWSCCDVLATSGSKISTDTNAHTGKANVIKNAKTATCTDEGYTGDIYWSCCDILATSGAVISNDKNAHTGKANVTKNTVTATCTDEGYTGDIYWSCCGTFAMSGVTIPKDSDAHTGKPSVTKNAKTATCKSEGYTGDIYWSCCGTFKEKGTSMPETKHSYGSYKTVKPATCTAVGVKEKVCLNCGDVAVAQVNKSDHTYKTVTTKATLTKNGKTVSVCDCGDVKSVKTICFPKTITLSATEYTYNGIVQTPSVTVKDSEGNTLNDYTVIYESGRKNTGRYNVRITFNGNYSGSKTLKYTIAPKVTSKISAVTSTSAIKLSWKKVTGADGYRIYQYNEKTKKWVKIKTITSGTTVSYKVKDLKAGTKYKFRIRAYTKDDGTIWGRATATFETATKTKTPTLKVTSAAKGKATFNWTNVSGESGYQVYYSDKKDGSYKKVSSYKANVLKGSKSKLTRGKTYYFKVRAYTKTANGTVFSAWSSVKSVKIK